MIEKYIERGKRKLTSGLEAKVYYNFRKITEEHKLKVAKWLESQVGKSDTIVAMAGISYEIAKLTNRSVVWYDPHEDEIEDESILTPFVIFDDVITTFGTIRKCILKIGILPAKIVCIKNRLNVVEFKEV